jgi:hypothetical protein
MAQPSNSTITIDGQKFNAMSAHVGVETDHDDRGMPNMGSLRCVINCTVDIHDTTNMPFALLKSLFQMSNVATKDKIKPIKIEFWQDEKQDDAICSYSFNGWISGFHTSGGGVGNHILDLRLTPELDQKQFIALTMAN